MKYISGWNVIGLYLYDVEYIHTIYKSLGKILFHFYFQNKNAILHATS